MGTETKEGQNKVSDFMRIDGRILSAGIIDNPPLLYIYINGIMTAARDDGIWIEGTKTTKVNKGEFICSISQITSRFGVSSQMARKYFERLKQLGFISECEVKRGIVVAKIANWEQVAA